MLAWELPHPRCSSIPIRQVMPPLHGNTREDRQHHLYFSIPKQICNPGCGTA